MINILKLEIMGHVKEPIGVDFIINSRPLTKREEEEISAYIKAYKAKQVIKSSSIMRTKSQLKSTKKVIA